MQRHTARARSARADQHPAAKNRIRNVEGGVERVLRAESSAGDTPARPNNDQGRHRRLRTERNDSSTAGDSSGTNSLRSRQTLRYNPRFMSQNEALKQFLDAAKAKGATNEALAALLRGRGWPEEDVYRALADHFEITNGLEIPTYKRSGSAKDAFLYL